jgi:hypothetical protein|tara:strand:- start:4070 stop:4486 length:417 start_codon:yes stop_codon:yes gene_type:complete
MAKISGLGDTISIDDSGGTARAISNDITDFSINNSQNLLDATGIDKSAMEKIIGLGDATVQISGVFNAASNMSHDVFKTKSGVRTVQITLYESGSTDPRLTMEMLIGNYDLSRGTDGSLNWTSTLSLSNGTVPAWSTS